MAMTKKERAEVDALLLKCRTVSALRWTDAVKPDVAPPGPLYAFGARSVGYAFNHHSLRVQPACSSTIGHAIGRTDCTDSQNPVWLFSTELLALKAMRHKVELECAAKLLKIDKMIEEHEGGSK